ncbi:hypothetical protein LEMLEM_LOCUS5059 [Lemmus lemmus]
MPPPFRKRLQGKQHTNSRYWIRSLHMPDRVSLCAPGCPGAYFVDRADLELIEICLPLPPKCCHHAQRKVLLSVVVKRGNHWPLKIRLCYGLLQGCPLDGEALLPMMCWWPGLCPGPPGHRVPTSAANP